MYLKLALNKVVLGFVLFIALTFGGVIFGASQGHALGTQFFDDVPTGECDIWDNDGTSARCSDGRFNTRLWVGQTDSVHTPDRIVQRLRAYYHLNRTATGRPIIPSGGLELTVYGADLCVGDNTGSNIGDKLNNGYYDNHPGEYGNLPSGGAGTIFAQLDLGPNIPGGNVTQTKYGRKRGDCSGDKSNRVFAVRAADLKMVTDLQTDTGQSIWYTEIQVTYVNHAPGNDGVVNSMYLKETSPNSANDSISTANTDSFADVDTNLQNGYRATLMRAATQQTLNAWRRGDGDFDAQYYSSYRLRFGAPCDLTAADESKYYNIQFYDLDYNTDRPIRLRMHDVTNDTWLTNFAGNRGQTWSRNEPSYGGLYIPPSSNNSLSTMRFQAKTGHKYILEILNVKPDLVQQYGLPFDGIYYRYDCAAPATVTPGVSISPKDLDPDPTQRAIATATLRNADTNDAVIASGQINVWYTNTMNIAPGASPNVSCPIANNLVVPAGRTITAGTCPRAAPLNFTYVCTNFVPQPAPNTTLSPPTAPSTPQCATVSYRPYLSVFGSDAVVGSAPHNGDATCSAPNYNAGFLGWNKGAPSFAGAGAQFAVQALGTINNFASGLNSASAAPSGLAFANVAPANNSGVSGQYGGKYGSVDGVNCDYTTDIKTGTVDAEKHTGDTTIPGRGVVSLGANNEQVIYVENGDAFIDGSILYANGQWNDVSKIPSFRLVVVGGDIYIKNTVTELHGTYVAEPVESSTGTTTGGRIMTCAQIRSSGPGQTYAEVLPTDPAFFATCKFPLTIYGSFVAQQVHFGRTTGSFTSAVPNETSATGRAAEKFVYGPAQWLSNLKTDFSSGDYSVTSLPPIL
jgi:hypothetical protein